MALNRSVKLLYNHLSCSTRSTSRPRPPLMFSLLLNEGIPLLGKCLLSSYSATHNNDDHHQIKHPIEALKEEGKLFVGAEAPLLEDAFVQVICEYEASYLGRPWTGYAGYRRRTTTGFIIDVEGRRLLTSAHCIRHNVSIKKKQGSDTLYQAKVIATAHDLDLVLLTVRDDEFWEGVRCVEFGDMPSPRDELTAMSYLEGMNSITSKSGFVSEVGLLTFSQGALKLPAFEVNYDSEFGESGSPVFNENGKCIGMTFDAPESINRGRAISATIIKHFIQDYDRNGGYTGVPIFGIKWQKMENHALRMYMEMQHDQEGVLVIDVDCGDDELDGIDLDDVILSIDGVKIANDGTGAISNQILMENTVVARSNMKELASDIRTSVSKMVPFVRGRRIDFNYLFTQRYTGDNVLIKVLRESKIHELSIKLTTHKQFVPGDVKGRPQSYYIIGGLVFTSVTIPYVRKSHFLGQNEEYYRSIKDELVPPILFEERVVVSQVLEAEVNKGYSVVDIINYQVNHLNFTPVKGLKELVSMVESCQHEYLCFILQNDQVVILQTNTAKETTPEILKTYGIPSAISDDLSDYLKTFRGENEEDET